MIKRQLTTCLTQIEKQLRQIDAAMADKVALDEPMSEKRAILTSIPGIATVTALAILIEMPGLGTLDGKQAAILAGLAPCLTTIWQMAGQGTYPSWTITLATCRLYARTGGGTLQPRPEGKMRSAHQSWKARQSRSHGNHAQAHCPVKCPAARRPTLDPNQHVTKTDTHIVSFRKAGHVNSQQRVTQLLHGQ